VAHASRVLYFVGRHALAAPDISVSYMMVIGGGTNECEIIMNSKVVGLVKASVSALPAKIKKLYFETDETMWSQ